MFKRITKILWGQNPETDIDGYDSKSLTILKHISAHFNVVIPFQKWLI